MGTSDTDEQLENAVIKFLTPVLIKITSPNETVRCKVSRNKIGSIDKLCKIQSVEATFTMNTKPKLSSRENTLLRMDILA